MTDPFRPFPAAAVTAQFDRARLERAGVPAETVDALEQSFPSLSDEERASFSEYVASHSDAAIAERYGEGLPPSTEGQSAPTEDSLMQETVDELEDRIRRWNADHEDDPEAHLVLSGRKVDLVGRLLDAYASEQSDGDDQAGTDTPPTPDGATGTVAAQTVPVAPVATTPEGTSTGTQTPDAAGAGATTTTGGTP